MNYALKKMSLLFLGFTLLAQPSLQANNDIPKLIWGIIGMISGLTISTAYYTRPSVSSTRLDHLERDMKELKKMRKKLSNPK